MAPNSKTKERSLVASLRALDAALADTLSLTKAISGNEDLQQRIKELENELQKARTKMENQQGQLEEARAQYLSLLNENRKLGDYFESRVQAWVKEKEDLEAKLQSTRKDMDTSNRSKMRDLSTKTERQAEQLRLVRAQLEDKDITMSVLQERLKQSQIEVENLKSATGLEEFGPDLYAHHLLPCSC
ncbi:hypothetical protein BBP40_007006 [Aspergillus hancockii]|nr:hypothetical protein BBP40_007006 [Aspergillus hancockii]